MSLRNFLGRTPGERSTSFPVSAGGIVTGALVVSALGVVCLMEGLSATATCAVASSFGALLPIVAIAVRRGWQEPRKCLAVYRRLRVHPPRHR